MKEIIIVETENGEKIKRFLDREHETYKVYNEDEKWRQDIQLANQDEIRNKEIAEWDAISDEDEWDNLTNNDESWN